MVQYYATELVGLIERQGSPQEAKHALSQLVQSLGGQSHLAQDMPMEVATLYALALLLRQY